MQFAICIGFYNVLNWLGTAA